MIEKTHAATRLESINPVSVSTVEAGNEEKLKVPLVNIKMCSTTESWWIEQVRPTSWGMGHGCRSGKLG